MIEAGPAGRTLTSRILEMRGQAGRLVKLLSAAVTTRASLLLLVMVLTRQLGPTDFGLFVFTIGGAMLAGMAGAAGWPLAFNRFFALYREGGRFDLLNGLMRASLLTVVGGAVAVALVLLLYSQFEETLSRGLIGAAILSIPYAITMLLRQQLAATGQAPIALFLDEGFASTVLLLTVLAFDLSLNLMLAVYFGAFVVGNSIAALLVRRKLPAETRLVTKAYEASVWARSGASLLVAQSARIALSRFDVLLIPALSNLTEAGIYGAAMRCTHLITFPQFVLQTITWPLFAEAFARNDHAKARKILAGTLTFALVTTLPVAAVILYDPEWIMRLLFGKSFESGGTALLYVTFAQIVLGLSVPFAGVLAMGAREFAFGLLNIAVLVVSAVLAFTLVPRLGATGGGIVFLAASSMLLVGQALMSRRQLRRDA